MTFLYFAYGSNMLTEWLRDRCPSAQPIGIAIAVNYRLVFGKRSIDKSGKATLARKEGTHTPGVIFEIAEGERSHLDAAEGFEPNNPHAPARYGRDDEFQIRIVETDSIATSTTYLANKAEDGLKPYDWYLALVITGAVQHHLDPGHIEMLRQIERVIDGNLTRENRVKALRIMKTVGNENE